MIRSATPCDDAEEAIAKMVKGPAYMYTPSTQRETNTIYIPSALSADCLAAPPARKDTPLGGQVVVVLSPRHLFL